MEQPRWVIRFNFTDGVCFAGMFRGALGFAPTTETALRFVSEEIARRNMINGYGPSVIEVAEVISLEEANLAATA